MGPITVTWQPILEGEDLDRARQELKELSAFLAAHEETGLSSLSRGEAGFALLWTYLGLPEREPRALSAARAHLDRAIDALATETLSPSLYAGISGIAWVHSHVERELFGGVDGDACAEVDEALLNLLERSPWRLDYDLIRGLAGYGVYWLERDPSGRSRRALELILDRMIECSRREPEGVTWHTPARLLNERQRVQYPDGFISLGVAHGVVGAIVVLAGMVARGIGGDRARSLMAEAFDWLLAQRLPPGALTSFANFAGEPVDAAPSRLAWCYGDAGIAAALYVAARATGHDEMRRVATEVGLKAARREGRGSGVADAGLCHGAAGVAHVFNRLYQWTGEEPFRHTSRTWFRNTFDRKRPAGATTPFPMWDPDYAVEKGWRPEIGVLEGAAGVALAIHAAVTEVRPDWDRFLLLSIPDPPGSSAASSPLRASIDLNPQPSDP